METTRDPKCTSNPWMRIALILALSWLILSNISLSSAKADQFAVVVGVAYGKPGDEESGIHTLRNTLKDAKLFAEYLGLPDKNIKALYDERSSTGSHLPTKENIFDALRKTFQQAKSDDIFWFYFSGHGLLINKKSYLAPQDVILGKISTFISVSEVRKLLAEECKAKMKILVLDACQSGSAKRIEIVQDNDSVNDLPDPKILEKNIVTLAACGVNQSAWEVEDMGGLFTYYLISGLNGVSQDKSASITIKDVELYVKSELKREVRERPLDSEQTPVFYYSEKLSSYRIGEHNQDKLDRLNKKKNKFRPTKIEPLQPGLILAIVDENHESSADAKLFQLQLRTALIQKHIPLVAEKEVAQFLKAFNSSAEDKDNRLVIGTMGSRFLVRGTLRKKAQYDTIARSEGCKLWLDIEVLDVDGNPKLAFKVEARSAGDSADSAEENAIQNGIDSLLKKLEQPVLSLIKTPLKSN